MLSAPSRWASEFQSARPRNGPQACGWPPASFHRRAFTFLLYTLSVLAIISESTYFIEISRIDRM